jgi:hypothetical protein
MSIGHAAATPAADLEKELRRLLEDLATMTEDERSLMVDPMKQAVTAIGGGFINVALAAMEREAGCLADVALRKAAGATSMAMPIQKVATPYASAPHRRFSPELREDSVDTMKGLIRVSGVVSRSTMCDLQAEMLTFGERGPQFRRLLIDFTEASFDLDDDEWDDFSCRWIATQPGHLGVGFVVADSVAHEELSRHQWAANNRGRIALVWKRRRDAVAWLGF